MRGIRLAPFWLDGGFVPERTRHISRLSERTPGLIRENLWGESQCQPAVAPKRYPGRPCASAPHSFYRSWPKPQPTPETPPIPTASAGGPALTAQRYRQKQTIRTSGSFPNRSVTTKGRSLRSVIAGGWTTAIL